VVRYRPRNAIVRNPDTPLDIALLLAPLLRKTELEEAVSASDLAPPLRLSCKAILEIRMALSEPPAQTNEQMNERTSKPHDEQTD
jgi:hypothetical protein